MVSKELGNRKMCVGGEEGAAERTNSEKSKKQEGGPEILMN